MDVGMPSGAVPTSRSMSRSGTREVEPAGPTSDRPTTVEVGSPARATQLQVQAVDFPAGLHTTGLHMEKQDPLRGKTI